MRIVSRKAIREATAKHSEWSASLNAWHQITKGAATGTNYQVLPGDRIFIAENKIIALDTWMYPGPTVQATYYPNGNLVFSGDNFVNDSSVTITAQTALGDIRCLSRNFGFLRLSAA